MNPLVPIIDPSQPAGVAQLQDLVVRIISISAFLAFLACGIVLFYAAIRYIVSGGDAKTLSSINLTVTWALLGVLFLVLAWLVFKLIEVFTGVPVTNFCIGFAPFCIDNPIK